MRSRGLQHLPAAAGASVGILIVSWFGLTDWAWTDYDREARPAFDALVSGHPLHFLQLVPSYGGSLILRAPFVLASKLWGAGELGMFRASAIPALIASGALAVWLVSMLRAGGAARVTRALALILCAANPITILAFETGHPEALLGAALCVGAVLAAMGNRPGWAGVLLGMAVANQEWAIVAAGPVLIALPERRVRALLIAASVGAAILLPLVAAGGFVGQVKGAATPNNTIFSPWQVWWFFGPHIHGTIPGEPWATRLDPAWVSRLAHPLIVGITLPLTLLCAWLRRRRAPRPENEALLLLVLLLLLRCALDPWDNWYYPLPFLLALLVWETLSTDRAPVLALLASAGVWFLTQWAVPSHGFSDDAQALLFMAMAVPASFAIIAGLYVPGFGQRLGVRRPRAAVPSAA